MSIPKVYVYSTGVYFPVMYRTADVPPPLPENTPEERRAAAEASFDKMSRGRQRVERLTVNGARVDVPSVKSHVRGFTAWAWSDSRAHQVDRPENAMRFQLDWPDFPGGDCTVPYPPPGSPTGPVRGAPTVWRDEHSSYIVLRSPGADPALTGEPPDEPV